MTYGRLKATVAGLLTGDNVLPQDPEVLLGLLGMAFGEVVTHSKALRLLTRDVQDDVARLGNGDYLVRYPEMPVDDVDVIDLDNELCYPVARFMAGYVSAQKSKVHYMEGRRLIREYNSKVEELLGGGAV